MKRGILLAAYGFGNIRGASALRAVQAAAEARFSLPVRWAFTSETMRMRLASSRTKSDSVLKALKRMRFERYTHVAVQPLHLIPGMEYGAVAAECRAGMEEGGLCVSLGLPLLSGPGEHAILSAARTLIRHISPLRAPDEPVICMAHGSRHECDILYGRWAEAVRALDSHIHIACMVGRGLQRPEGEALPADGLDMLLPALAEEISPTRRVWLMPLLSLVGRHTLEDMAGAAPTSWKSRIEAAGYCCQAELRGLADDAAFVDLWLDRLEEALAALDDPALPCPPLFPKNSPSGTSHPGSLSSFSAPFPTSKESAMSASVLCSAMEQNLSQGSMIRRMFEAGIELRKKYGADAVCDFSLGNPDLAPPAEAAHAMSALAARLSEPGILGYMPNGGFAWAREKLAAWLSEQQKTALEAKHVMLGCGAAGVMNAFFHTVLDPGDEVLTVAPFFGEYRFYVGNHGGTLRPVPCRAEDFGPDVEALSAAVTPRTRAVIINSPNNPSGAVYTKEDIEALAAMLEEASKRIGRIIYLIADEPYRFLAYDGLEVPAALPLYKYAVVISSFAKNYGMAGERVGYIAVNPAMDDADKLMDGLIFSNRVLGFVNPPVVGQYLMAECLGTSTQEALAVYTRRRNRLAAILADAGYEFTLPRGTFYFFPKAPGGDDKAIVERLTENLVLAVPSSGFGYPGYFRLSFAVEDAVIERSAEGFRKALRG
ncbi:pyridoxal phosphate-dependent aminotransferase [uncultured Mailhella sp.]|uniref:pyridoxal phosphate-dependent aminotransferase n=1 Tax=uncultured Mailhella sp. TaxID=1981031 RepID=UPI00345B6C37